MAIKTMTIENPVDGIGTIEVQYYTDFPCGYRFRHVAQTADGDVRISIGYKNRTWERFVYESVLYGFAWNWLLRNTRLNPKTKRDHDTFEALYRYMTNQIDKKLMPSCRMAF